MNFGALFIDAVRQANNSGIRIVPLIAMEVIESNPENMPNPNCLGDFVKLFEGPPFTVFRSDALGDAITIGMQLKPWKFRKITDWKDLAATPIEVLEGCMRFSRQRWAFAHRGELQRVGLYPEYAPGADTLFEKYLKIIQSRKDGDTVSDSDSDAMRAMEMVTEKIQSRNPLQEGFIEENSLRILHAMYVGLFENDGPVASDWEPVRKWLQKDAEPEYSEHLLTTAAMVCCNLPISLREWMNGKFTPVLAVPRTDRSLSWSEIGI
jgi:hypothetical protein